MSTATSERRYTPEDLLSLGDGPRRELIDGRLVEKPMGARASLIATVLIALLRMHARAHRLGLAFGADCGYQIFGEDANRVRFPDGSFIRSGRLPNDQPPEGHVRIPPDLAIEVVSPNDEACEIDRRIEDYLSVGVPLIWVVYPSTKRVMVFRPSGSISRLTPADQLSGEEVLPGFACPVEEIFATI